MTHSALIPLQQAAAARRSQYDLGKQLPINAQELREIFLEIVLHTPSGFNAQTGRLVLVLGREHERLWQGILAAQRPHIGDSSLQKELDRFARFIRAAGTVLFFEEGDILCRLERDYPDDAYRVPLFSAHTSAMHQYAAWTQLTALGLGANLQHYNRHGGPVMRAQLDLPESWEPHAQLVFGSIVQPTQRRKAQRLPAEERLKVVGELIQEG